MLHTNNRLRARKDFELLWKRGRSVYGHSLGIRFAKNELKESRFGVVVGLKVHKRAVKRNLVRRRIREAIRREHADKIKGYDVAIIVRKEALDLPYQKLKDELGLLFQRAKLYA